MPLTIRITGNIQFGLQVYPHTLYRVEVTNNGDNWYIYRRFSEFHCLYTKFAENQNDEKLKDLFPERAFLSTRSEVINERMSKLQQFIIQLLKIEDIDNNSTVQKFFDFDGKGQSGPVRDLGEIFIEMKFMSSSFLDCILLLLSRLGLINLLIAGLNQIIFETFCQVKPGLLPLEFWTDSFVVLTKQGTIYVMKGIYDPITAPYIAYSVSSSVHINSNISSFVIELQNRVNNQKLYLRFATNPIFASWLRTLAEFSTKSSAITPSESLAKNYRQDSVSTNNSNRDSNRNANIHQQDASNKPDRPDSSRPDDLSALYGV